MTWALWTVPNGVNHSCSSVEDNRVGQVSNIQFLSHEILLVAKPFDPLNACLGR